MCGRLETPQIMETRQLPEALILLTSDVGHLQEAIEGTVRLIPDASITLVAQEDIATGLQGFDSVDKMITAPRAGSLSFGLSLPFLKELRSRRYDVCVLLQKQKTTRVGIRAIALAYIACSSRRLAHISGVGLVPFSRAVAVSLGPSYLLRGPGVLLDKLLAILIRKAADLIVGFMLLRDRRRCRRSRGSG